MGIAVWLYLLLVDWANWETGAVITYRDKDAAEALELPIDTVRKWRRKLEDELYIKTLQKQTHQRILINNWNNPREYSGVTYNVPGTEPKQPELPDHGYEEDSGLPNLATPKNEGDHQGDHQGSQKRPPLQSNSQITNHTKDINHNSEIEECTRQLENSFTVFQYMNYDHFKKKILAAPKTLDGKMLRILMEDDIIREEGNKKFPHLMKQFAMAQFRFGAVVLQTEEEYYGKEEEDAED
jgi:hypothetical protein